MSNRATVAFRLNEDEQQRLDALAARTGRTRSFYVRQALQLHLDDLEELFWADEVVDRWESSRQNTRPADEVWKELGL